MVDPDSNIPRNKPRHDPYEGDKAVEDPQSVLIRSKVAPDLLEDMSGKPEKKTFRIIIEFNEYFPGGAHEARNIFFELLTGGDNPDRLLNVAATLAKPGGVSLGIDDLSSDFAEGVEVQRSKSLLTSTYAFACVQREKIRQLVELDFVVKGTDGAQPTKIPLIHRIWLDHALERFVYESGRTIKADAAIAAFACRGDNIIWAVADTGIDRSHPHFQTHQTLDLPAGIRHRDFTSTEEVEVDICANRALEDEAGHGTHVAGIIAGETRAKKAPEDHDENAVPMSIVVERDVRLNEEKIGASDQSVERISGIAPACKIVSLKVLGADRRGNVSDLLAAIGYIQSINDHGRRIRIHGLNLSVGYSFDPVWFAPGQSALCVEVNRLVRSGVVVVTAAGNGGYGRVMMLNSRVEQAAFMCTIADPGNAELAITVGSTHRDMPHTYGVSYFSAKGPTADGRAKPDLVAPGERIVSCKANSSTSNRAVFCEDSGTSMAAPHVSGAIAAFLSVRREFIGQPERIKEIFMDAATDLRRRSEFQGGGALDLMRTLQSI